jgi:hypothetical protein
MSNEQEIIDVNAEVTPVEDNKNITPILEIGLTEDGKSLGCKQLSEFEFNVYMVNAVCQVVINFFKNSLPEEKKENFELLVLDLILQTKNYKQDEKPTLITL